MNEPKTESTKQTADNNPEIARIEQDIKLVKDADGKETVDNQHKHIKGYRNLTVEEINLMNEAKELSIKVGALVTKLGTSDVVPTQEGIDQRWLSIAKTDLQKGFMSLIRSIARPTTF